MVFRQAEVDTQFFTPRAYQQDLVEKALERNIIVPLGTGTGKTYIAVMLIKELAAALRRHWPDGAKRSFFIVDKVALVRQQAEQIRNHTDLSVGEYHGGKNVDLWNENRWTQELLDSQVMVMTAQIFVDLLNHGFLSWSRVRVLVIDECHHALGANHPYRKLMENYKSYVTDVPEDERPRVLGLTASVVGNTCDPVQLKAQIRELESALQSRIETTSEMTQVSKYGAKPKIKLILCHDYAPNEVAKHIDGLLQKAIDFSRMRLLDGNWKELEEAVFHKDLDIDPTKPYHEALKRIRATLEILGPWAAWKVCGIWESQLRKLNDFNMTEMQELFICMALTYIRATKALLAPMASIDSLEGLLKTVPDKVARLIEVLRKLNPAVRFPDKGKTGAGDSKKSDDFAGIVFVEQRYVAYILKVLRGFRSKQLNLLIATAVLEEGVDVRHCNLVLRFDAPSDYRSYVQSRGRARKENSLYIILIEQRLKLEYSKKLDDFGKIEAILAEHSESQGNPPAVELDSGLVSAAEQMLAPYVVPSTGPDQPAASVSITTAIALVNRYCAKLPSDIFTKLVPRSEVEEVFVPDIGTLYYATLVLPINSPVKETIRSKIPMKNKKLAQMAVALEVCQELHKRGELDDHLLPVGKESVCRLLNELEDDGEIWPLDGRARPGSTKRKQYYDRKVAEALKSSQPEPGRECYLHAIRFKLEVPATGPGNPKNRRLHDPADSHRFLGLLSLKPIPKIPGFPLFARQGKMSCVLETLPGKVTLDDEAFALVAQFHRFLFSDILKFEDAIVMPWYRNEEAPHCFYVAGVRNEKTPGEPFPDDKFPSFNVYFREKYKLEIYDQEQPLLDVDYTTSRLNLLLPRNQNRRGQILRGREERKGRGESRPDHSSQMQLLVPELVDVHPIPATLWNQIVLLPSFLYRLNYLLLADELRTQIETEAFRSLHAHPSDDFQWDPMEYSWASPAKSAKAEVAPAAEEVPLDFEIGTWDPSLGEGLTWGPPTAGGGPVPMNGLTMVGGGNGLRGINGDPMASDDEDEDVMINLEFSRHMKDLEKKSPAQIAADASEQGALLLEPRADIQPMGWDVAEAESAATVDGLTILSVPDGIFDKTRFVQDIAADESVKAATAAAGDTPDPLRERTLSIAERERMLSELEEDKERRPQEETLDTLLHPLTIPDDDVESSEPCAVEILEATSLGRILEPAASKPCYPKSGDESQRGQVRQLGPSVVRQASKPKPSAASATANFLKTAAPPPKKPMEVECIVDRPIMDLEENMRPQYPHGPSPALILQALTLSASNDGINLERLETVGDSFLKFATTVYLFNTPEGRKMHEGKLSFMRSKQVSNYYLYRLAKRAGLGSLLVSSKLEPHDNWLPPCYVATQPQIANAADPDLDDNNMEKALEGEEVEEPKKREPTGWDSDPLTDAEANPDEVEPIDLIRAEADARMASEPLIPPYNILSQQSIADKSMADAVEALIGVYLLSYGPQGALTFMDWLGLRVQTQAVELPDPLLNFIEDPRGQLEHIWATKNFSKVEETLGYTFNKKAYLVQAFTHASYYHNRITDCYQRLEFLGDAVLDYAITRYLYEDERKHSPGVLTDLRSALVNNTIFASLAVKYDLHKYFMELCPNLHFVIDKFVKLYQEKRKEANFDEELYFLGEEEVDAEEDVEVPKSLGDIFESIAGAIYLDSGCSLMAVWTVYHGLMKEQLEKCCRNPPKSPIRELLELEPDNAKFSKLERLVKEGKVRVTVDVSGRRFTGMGRNYRIAKCTAAKRALRELKADKAQRPKP